MKSLWILTAIVLCFSGCSSDQASLVSGRRDLAMIGGVKFSKGDELSKSTVGISLEGEEEGRRGEKSTPIAYCTGTLIAPRLVLTAAHCFLDGKMSPKKVTFYAKGTKSVKPKSVHILPAYHTSQRLVDNHDLAVIKLSSDAPKGAVVAQFANELEANLSKGEHLYVAGIGRSRATGIMSKSKQASFEMGDYGEGVMRKSVIYFDSFKGETKAVAFNSPNGSTLGGPCVGDSGGPAYIKINGVLKVLGTMTSVADNRLCDSITYITLAGPHGAWINQMIEWSRR